MKKLFLMATLLVSIVAAKAQISEIKISGSLAWIYNDQGNSGKYISLGGFELAGYNSSYAVIADRTSASIYDSNGSNTGYTISLVGGKTVQNVTGSYILIKDGNNVYYYDFKGSFIR